MAKTYLSQHFLFYPFDEFLVNIKMYKLDE
jgi:hypothetical protein